MKYLKYILILIILMGLTNPTEKVSALDADLGNCTYTVKSRGGTRTEVTQLTEAECRAKKTDTDIIIPISWTTCIFTANNRGQARMVDPSFTETQCKTRTPPGTWLSSSYATNPTTNTTTTQTTPASQKYTLLAPLPCPKSPGDAPNPDCNGDKLETFKTDGNLGSYLNLMIKIFIGLCAVLSVVMIVMGGLEYMTSELSHSKEAGKEKIEHAILGLLIALGAYALLFTINPDLLKSDIEIKDATPPAAIRAGTATTPTNP